MAGFRVQGQPTHPGHKIYVAYVMKSPWALKIAPDNQSTAGLVACCHQFECVNGQIVEAVLIKVLYKCC